jgi:hypothetical protein
VNKKIVGFLLCSLSLGATQTPFMHDWYDGRTTQMKFNFDYNQYDPQLTYTLQKDQPTNSLASISYVNNMVLLEATGTSTGGVGGGGGSLAQMNTMAGIDWAAGHETHIMFTMAIPLLQGSSGLFQSSVTVGLGDFENAFSLYLNNDGAGTEKNLLVTLRGATVGNPAVVLPANITKLNLYRIVVSDKSVGTCTLDFYNGATNTWSVIGAVAQLSDTPDLPVLSTLHLPFSIAAQVVYEINSSLVGTATAQVLTTGWHIMTVGDPYRGSIRTFSAQALQSVFSAETHVMTLQNVGFNNDGGLNNNYVAIKIKSFGASGAHHAYYKMYKNATVNGTSYTSIDANNSVIQQTTTGTYVAGTGTEVFATAYNAKMGTTPLFDSDEPYILVYPGETLTITSQLPFDDSDMISASIVWDELF